MKKLLICTVFAALAMLLTVFLTGCKGFDFFGELFSKGNAAPDEIAGESENEPKPFPVIIDGIVIEESPAQIISLSPALTEILFEFGQGERLIGRSDYCNYPLSVKDIENIQGGSGFDVEKIIRRSPDLLLLSSPIAEKDRVALEREGIAAVVIPAPRSLVEFRNVYRIIGLILNGAFIGEQEGEVVFSDVARAFNNPEAFNLGDFVYITENMLVATGGTLESEVLSCFGNNVAQEGEGYVFNKKELLVIQPDVILLNDIYSEEDLSEDEIFSELDAVLEGRIIFLNNSYFERPSARIITLILEMQAQYVDLKI
ncbi:MAG: ABC transporter substrate-binding protein [Oscillospiraceae bacterium]|nr:ABC transporter substrate-binding protein [Oscillospiraceae bacterium]